MPGKLKPRDHLVLDWLCRHPAQIYSFSEVADELKQTAKITRADVEAAFAALKHPRNGSPIGGFDPWGNALRTRFAYIPPTSDARKGYPKLEHPTLEQPAKKAPRERPSAVRSAYEDKRHAQHMAKRALRKQQRQKIRSVNLAEAQGRREEALARRKALAASREAAQAGPSVATPAAKKAKVTDG